VGSAVIWVVSCNEDWSYIVTKDDWRKTCKTLKTQCLIVSETAARAGICQPMLEFGSRPAEDVQRIFSEAGAQHRFDNPCPKG